MTPPVPRVEPEIKQPEGLSEDQLRQRRETRREQIKALSLDPKTEALAHLLACLDSAAEMLHESLADVDAYVIEAHRAQLAAGREWPGDPVVSPWPVVGPAHADERDRTVKHLNNPKGSTCQQQR